MIAAAVTAIMLFPMLGLLLGVIVWQDRKRRGPQPEDVPFLIAAALTAFGQYALELAREYAHIHYEAGTSLWTWLVYTIGAFIGLGLMRRYFNASTWPLFLGSTLVISIVSFVPPWQWLGAIGMVAHIATPATLMALNSTRVASGRRTGMGYAGFTLAALLLAMYPTVVTDATPMSILLGLICTDVGLLVVALSALVIRMKR